MPVRISVDGIYEEIYKLTEGCGSKIQRTDPFLAALFHESFSQLLGKGQDTGWTRLIDKVPGGEGARWKALQDYLYDELIGPKIARYEEKLRHKGDQVVDFWAAAREMCRWLIDLYVAAMERTTHRKNAVSMFECLISGEKKLSVKLKEKSWSDAVILAGMNNLVLKVPGKDYWCIVDLKLGDENQAVDMLRACLYQQILILQKRAGSHAIAFIDFKPEREERLLSKSDLAEPQRSLKALVGRVAGVIS